MRIVSGEKQVMKWIERLEKRRTTTGADARRVAARLIRDVRKRGDAAAADALHLLDGLTVEPKEIASPPLSGELDPAMRSAIDIAIERITFYHRGQMIGSYSLSTAEGELAQRVRPYRRVGVYVPGGRAIYLSTLMMCAIPARLAGVPEIVVATTPRAASFAELGYVCERLGIRLIYRCGGAAGIAALAYGTESMERVDKIVGPGNQYVAAAKQLVAADVSIDMTAGPSEIVVIADDSADPEWVAADLLAQAEHGADSSVICVTLSAAWAARLRAELSKQLLAAGSDSAVSAMATGGVIFVASSAAEAVAIADRLAPEHLSIQTENPGRYAERVENCGSLLVGGFSAVAASDYIVGTNHVLPTAGTARFGSPLGVYDFLKRTSVVALNESATSLFAAAEAIALFEGLPLHARSMQVRREKSNAGVAATVLRADQEAEATAWSAG